MWNAAPPAGTFSAQMLPPCASMMRRQMYSPSPIPAPRAPRILGDRDQALQQPQLDEPVQPSAGLRADGVGDLVVLRPPCRDGVEDLPAKLAEALAAEEQLPLGEQAASGGAAQLQHVLVDPTTAIPPIEVEGNAADQAPHQRTIRRLQSRQHQRGGMWSEGMQEQ